MEVQLSATSIVSRAPLAEKEPTAYAHVTPEEKVPATYVHVATLPSVAVHEPGVAPKSVVPAKVQWVVSAGVTVATSVDVQLSAVSIVSNVPSESASEYAPAT